MRIEIVYNFVAHKSWLELKNTGGGTVFSLTGDRLDCQTAEYERGCLKLIGDSLFLLSRTDRVYLLYEGYFRGRK